MYFRMDIYPQLMNTFMRYITMIVASNLSPAGQSLIHPALASQVSPLQMDVDQR